MLQQAPSIRVWDPFVRLFHWTLTAAVLTAWVSGEEWPVLHVLAGYTVLGLVSLRIVWGVIGTRHARFTDFVHGPSTVLAYLKDVVTLRARRYVGHNPAGGAMVIALLLGLTLTTLSGLVLYGYQEFSGPLAGPMYGAPPRLGSALEETHAWFVNLTMLLVVLHLAGVALASLQHGENLVRSMFTGHKQQEPT
jgi:cytochrome b